MDDQKRRLLLLLSTFLCQLMRRTFLQLRRQRAAQRLQRRVQIRRERTAERLRAEGRSQERLVKVLQFLKTKKATRLVLLQHLRQAPTAWAFSRSTVWWDFSVPGFTHTDWVNTFRMSEQTFVELCSKLQPQMERQNTNFRSCIPLKKRVAIALWKLATNNEYRTIGHLFGVSKTSVCRCVQDFCRAAQTLLLPDQIRLPDQRTCEAMATFIEEKWGLPQCLGAIGRSHIPVTAQQEHQADNLNRKGRHSIVLQGAVDGKGLFWSVSAGTVGSTHGARVLRRSALWDMAESGNLFPASTRNIAGVNVGYYLLGDAAYPLKPWLLKPFPDNGRLTAQQVVYNNTVSGARVELEKAFGRLKGRWRCLLKRNDSDIELTKQMALACCALHNLCESRGEDYQLSWDAVDPEPVGAGQDVDHEGAGLQDVDHEGAGVQDVDHEGAGVQDALMQYFSSF